MPLLRATSTGHARGYGVCRHPLTDAIFPITSRSARLRLLAGVAGVVEQDFLAQACGVEVQVYLGG